MNSQTLTLVGYFAVFFGIMYFLMIRPQQKQQKLRVAMLSSLRIRDKVITSGGIYGKIIKVKEKSVILQIAEKVEVEVDKAGITSIENREVTVEKDKKNNDKVKLEKEETSTKDSEEDK
ncbi:MAG: preprotein translocase subunit YajC [Desulfitobacteriaceae bacterium]